MIGGLHSEGRGNFPTLEVDFLETNYSFTDFVLRPWSIAVAHNGLKNEKFTNFNINCWHLAKTLMDLFLENKLLMRGLPQFP